MCLKSSDGSFNKLRKFRNSRIPEATTQQAQDPASDLRARGLESWSFREGGCRGLGSAVDDINPALPKIRNIPQFPFEKVLKVMLWI